MWGKNEKKKYISEVKEREKEGKHLPKLDLVLILAYTTSSNRKYWRLFSKINFYFEKGKLSLMYFNIESPTGYIYIYVHHVATKQWEVTGGPPPFSNSRHFFS